MKLTASYKKSGKWYIGWIEEVPGINTQGRTLKECRENLADAFSLISKVSKKLNKKEFGGRRMIHEPFNYR